MARLIAFTRSDLAVNIFKALILVIIGFAVSRLVSASIMRAVRRYLDAQQGMLLRKVIYYLLLSLFVVSALREMGFSLGALLGAAGVFTVAIGFASQTSASNLISGIFLIGERSFQIGDFIKVEDTTGEVLSIDLLSVKLRTLDNLHVRIPNETMIKSEVTNLTKFPIRRVDLKVGVAYKEDIGKVRRVLLSVADKNPLCLEEPKPRFYFLGFGDSSLDLQFSVWVKKENFLDLRTSMHEEIKAAFDREGIEIPFPHLSIYTGSVTEPMPIAIINKKKMTEMVEDEQTLPQGGENTL
ncbi:MAG: mechanosensitive ion channel protein [Desulfobacteraceae bacterium CG2_30_51_40]|nr:MAG: mechanosensitive ion channel protein [Desulfobacteraceae bacterium CG2_30_51_40]